MKRVVVAVLLVLIATFPAVADEVDDAFVRATAAYHRGDYEAALKDLRFAAGHGNGPAQYDIGLMYQLGQGVPLDYTEAIKWYGMAVEHGVAQAAINLGRMYAKGEGVAQDYVQAYVWTSLAVAGLPPGEDRDGAAKNLDLDAAELSPDEIARAKKLAQEWIEKHTPKSN